MSEFKRYFTHFLVVISLLSGVLFLIGEPRLSWGQMAILFGMTVLIFVLPMSAVYAQMSRVEAVKLPGSLDEVKNQLTKVISEKAHRVISAETDITCVYSYQCKLFQFLTPYGRWLTNDITLISDPSGVTVDGPKHFIRYLKNIYS